MDSLARGGERGGLSLLVSSENLRSQRAGEEGAAARGEQRQGQSDDAARPPRSLSRGEEELQWARAPDETTQASEGASRGPARRAAGLLRRTPEGEKQRSESTAAAPLMLVMLLLLLLLLSLLLLGEGAARSQAKKRREDAVGSEARQQCVDGMERRRERRRNEKDERF